MQIARLAPRLDKVLFDVQVAYYDDINLAHPADMLKDAGIKVTFLNRPQWGRLTYFSRATAFVRRERFDIVHAWNGTTNLYARFPAILAGVPTIVGGLRGQADLSGIIARLIYSLTNYRCAGWLVNASNLKVIIEQKLWFMKNKPIFVVPNGLELELQKTDTAEKEADKFYRELRTIRPVIGTIGRLHPVKNHLLFVQMARNLTQGKVDADYWIIGEGPSRPRIEQAIRQYKLQDRFKMLGYRADVNSALAAMDMLVLTSNTEGCPNALLEAMRASLPVVSTNCTNLEEIIEEGVNGYTVPVGNAAGLAEKVKRILLDPELKKQMGINSRKIIENRFSVSLTIKRLQDMYIDCLKRVSSSNEKLKMKLEALGL